MLVIVQILYFQDMYFCLEQITQITHYIINTLVTRQILQKKKKKKKRKCSDINIGSYETRKCLCGDIHLNLNIPVSVEL